jgi:hypothetical protein
MSPIFSQIQPDHGELTYSTFRAVWIRGAGVKPLRGRVVPTPPVPNSCENRCN